jgi:hypothetical protein
MKQDTYHGDTAVLDLSALVLGEGLLAAARQAEGVPMETDSQERQEG